MKKIASRIAVIVGAVAVSAGLMGAVATPAATATFSASDSSWGR